MPIRLRFYLLHLLLLLLHGQNLFAQAFPTADRPNILFAISDDQSFPHTSFAGCGFVATPAFDRVARTGVYFANCMAGSPGCAPSRSSIVTGRYHWQNEQAGQHASGWLKKYVPFVDVLAAGGYYVGKSRPTPLRMMPSISSLALMMPGFRAYTCMCSTPPFVCNSWLTSRPRISVCRV